MKSLNKEYILMFGKTYISEEEINIFQFLLCTESCFFTIPSVLTYWDETQP